MRKKVVVSFMCSFLKSSQRRQIVRILCNHMDCVEPLIVSPFSSSWTCFLVSIFIQILASIFISHARMERPVTIHPPFVKETSFWLHIDSSSTKVISFMFIWVRQGLWHTDTVDYSAICDSHCEFSIGNWEAELCSKTISEPISQTKKLKIQFLFSLLSWLVIHVHRLIQFYFLALFFPSRGLW